MIDNRINCPELPAVQNYPDIPYKAYPPACSTGDLSTKTFALQQFVCFFHAIEKVYLLNMLLLCYEGMYHNSCKFCFVIFFIKDGFKQ